MDPPRLIIAAIGIGLLVLIVWSDWRVRSARTCGLLVVVFGLFALSAIADIPTPVVWVLVSGLVVLMVLHPPWLAPLAPADFTMVGHIAAIERALVRASDAYRKGQVRLPELHDKFAQIRRRLARLDPPDEEWRRVIRLLRADLDGTMAAVAGTDHRSPDAAREDRRRIRAIYSGLVKSRLRFWR